MDKGPDLLHDPPDGRWHPPAGVATADGTESKGAIAGARPVASTFVTTKADGFVPDARAALAWSGIEGAGRCHPQVVAIPGFREIVMDRPGESSWFRVPNLYLQIHRLCIGVKVPDVCEGRFGSGRRTVDEPRARWPIGVPLLGFLALP